MPPKKSSAPKKAAKTSVNQQTRPVTDDHADVVAQNAVQPATITTNDTTEQHNSAALSEEAVRRRAYEFYQQHRTDGRHAEDWFRAENEIRGRRNGHSS